MPVDNHHKWPWIQGRFEVKKIIKGGVQSKEITLTTGLGRSDCGIGMTCLLYTSPSPRDGLLSRMPSSA